jgi:hypothetical protein
MTLITLLYRNAKAQSSFAGEATGSAAGKTNGKTDARPFGDIKNAML